MLTIYLTNKLFTPFNAHSFSLNAFSPHDPLAILAIVAFGISIFASYPLTFINLRNRFIEQAQQLSVDSNSLSSPVRRLIKQLKLDSQKVMTFFLLSIIGALAMVCRDIGKVGSFAGSLFGSSMMFIFPPMMYLSFVYRNYHGSGDDAASHIARREGYPLAKVLLNIVLLAGGIGITSFGTINNIRSWF